MTNQTDRVLGTTGSPARLEGTALDNRGASRSNFLAFVIGGLVIAVGFLTFFYYDGRQAGAGDLVAARSFAGGRP